MHIIQRMGFLAVLLLSAVAAPAQDAVFRDGFEADLPQSDAHAARFLTQATFGPNAADIANLRTIGYSAWLTQQMALPVTEGRPYLEAKAAEGLNVSQGQRLDRWFHSAVVAPDQLRQRVAFALSEIMVVSDRPDNLTNDWAGIAEFDDILKRGAFGSFRDLLEQVSMSPQMGKYLSHWRNRKASATTQPDENFAREIMQLFSIGLVWLNPDGTPMQQGGAPIPTYDQSVISELAQVFTGFGNRCPTPPGLCNPYTGISSVFDSYQPMACFPLPHDLSTKLLLDLDPGVGINRVTLPAGPACDPAPANGSALQTQCFAYCASDLDGALDMLANHPNVPPFLAQQLIQKLVTSNPSPAYVQRVASAFDASGRNLGALVRAVLLDPEARAFNPAAADLGQPANFGKLREPLLRLTAFWRAFDAQAGVCAGSCLDQSGAPPTLSELRMGQRAPQVAFLQRPLGAPSVFNFFEPDFRQPGPIANAGLYAPEFQIFDETSSVTAANELWSMVWPGYSTNDGTYTAPPRNASIPTATLDALPNDAAGLVDAMNARLLYGSMSGSYTAGNCAAGSGMKGTLYKLLQCDMAAADARRKKLGLLHLVLVSPEYAVQR